MAYAGKLIQRTYLLLYEIGEGIFSNVWLACNINDRKYYAVKINKEDTDFGAYEQCLNEAKLYYNLEKHDNIISIKDTVAFKEDGENFICIVTELMACNLDSLISGKYINGLPMNLVKTITKQLLFGLETLHKKLIHTDFKVENILVKGHSKTIKQIIENFEDANFFKNLEKIEKQMGSGKKNNLMIEIKKLGENVIEQLEDKDEKSDSSSDYETDEEDESDDDSSNDNSRHQSVADDEEILTKGNENLEKYYEFDLQKHEIIDNECIIDDCYLNNIHVVIGDLGNVQQIGKTTGKEIQARIYRSPESIINIPYNEKVDIWSLGCILFEIATGNNLFEPLSEPLNKDIHHLFLIQAILGEIPKNMILNSARKEFLFKNNRIRNVVMPKSHPLKEILKDYDEDFIDFLSKCLTIDPALRPSASQLMKHDFIKN